MSSDLWAWRGRILWYLICLLPKVWPDIHVNVNAFSLRTVQNVIMLNVQTQYLQLRVLVERKLSLWGVAEASSSVWNVTTNKLILPLLMDIVQVGNNTVTDWLVFALEHTDLSKIIANNPSGHQFFYEAVFPCLIVEFGYKYICFLYSVVHPQQFSFIF